MKTQVTLVARITVVGEDNAVNPDLLSLSSAKENVIGYAEGALREQLNQAFVVPMPHGRTFQVGAEAITVEGEVVISL